MNSPEYPVRREAVPYWREADAVQNFGDFLTDYLLEHLFIRLPQTPRSIRIIGSYLADFMVADAKDARPAGQGGASLVAWGGGLREPAGLRKESLKDVEILSVRGPLTASELGLSGVVPLGDPGLLLPALYTPKPALSYKGKTVCVPHFDDKRSDEELISLTGADAVLRPNIRKSFYELENFIDVIASADFLLCGALHGAITAAAYGKPFGFYDSGEIDIPFKWKDFAASCNFEAAFFATVAESHNFYTAEIHEKITLPSMWPMLANAPFFIRNKALFNLLKYDIDNGTPFEAVLQTVSNCFRNEPATVQKITALTEQLIHDINQERLADTRAKESLVAALGNARADLQQTSAELANSRAALVKTDNNFALAIQAADNMAQTIYRAYRKPLHPLKQTLSRGLLKLALKLPTISDKRREKLKRQIAKRRPANFIERWDAIKSARLNIESAANSGAGRNALGQLRYKSQFDQKERPRIFVSDYRIPRADVSAGEQATVGMLSDLCALGYDVTFMPHDMHLTQPYASRLTEIGVNIITRESGYEWGCHYLSAHADEFDTFYLIRIDVAEEFIPIIRNVAEDATIIFHAPDLHYLREERAAELSQDTEQMLAAGHTKQRELSVMRAADHVVLVSPAEVPYVKMDLPENTVSVFPALYSDTPVANATYDERRDIFFIGGFKHTPNVDSVIWFVEKIWAEVHKNLPDAEFHIVGAEAPPEVIALGERPGVRFVGYVEDLAPELQKYRVGVAPLLYGAGIKGKVGAMMGAGMSTVCTTIAAEGMGIIDGIHAIVRDEPLEQAKAIVDLYSDKENWQRISKNGSRLVEDTFGLAANRSSFYTMLNNARALPLKKFMEYCAASDNQSFAVYDEREEISVSIIIPVYNKWELTRNCLISVASACRATGISYEVILADDGSSDETLNAAVHFKGLRVVKTPENMGFLRNCNNAAQHARGQHILLLNNDTIVMPGWLEEMYSVLMKHPQAAIVGSKLLYPDGTIQEAGGALFKDASGWNLGRGCDRFHKMWNFQREVDYISGASILVRGNFWRDLGGFDKRYGNAYCEDSDLAMEARNRGMSVIYTPKSEVVHFEHASYGEQLSNQPKQLQIINGQKLFEKWKKVFNNDHAMMGSNPTLMVARGRTRIKSR